MYDAGANGLSAIGCDLGLTTCSTALIRELNEKLTNAEIDEWFEHLKVCTPKAVLHHPYVQVLLLP